MADPGAASVITYKLFLSNLNVFIYLNRWVDLQNQNQSVDIS
jgi:hypothetical protein